MTYRSTALRRLALWLPLCCALLPAHATVPERPAPPTVRQSAGPTDPADMYDLAETLRTGALPDPAGARFWYARAAELGHTRARFVLAWMLMQGVGGERDADQGMDLYRAGAAAGERNAMYVLASRYDAGEGVHQDYAQARQWFINGAELGDTRAMTMLGMYALQGTDQPVDLVAAVAWFRRAASEENPRALFMLGICLEEGKGVARDAAAAAVQYRRAAALGVLSAADRLIAMQLAGTGMPVDRAGAQAAIDQTIAGGGATQMLQLAVVLLWRQQDADAAMVVQHALNAPAPPESRLTHAFAEALGALGSAYVQRQELDQGGVHLRASVALLEYLPDVSAKVLADALEKLGDLAFQQGRYDDADRLYARTLVLHRQAGGDQNAGVADAYGNLANVCVGRDQLARAETYRRRALAVRIAIFGAGATQTEQARLALAQTLYMEGKYAEAQPLFLEPFLALEAKVGPAHPSLRDPLNNLAYNAMAMGRHADAEQAARRALALQQASDEPAPGHRLATALNTLGAALTGAGNYAEAGQQLHAGLAMREQVLGKNHVDVAISLTNLGKLYIAQARYGEADQALARARTIVEGFSGKEHAEVAVIEYQQGLSRYRQHAPAQAEPLLVHALAIQLRARPGHPDTAQTAALLAALYRDADNEDAARRAEAAVQDAAAGAAADAARIADGAGGRVS